MIDKFESGKWYRYDGTDKIKQYLEEIAQRDKLIAELDEKIEICKKLIRQGGNCYGIYRHFCPICETDRDYTCECTTKKALKKAKAKLDNLLAEKARLSEPKQEPAPPIAEPQKELSSEEIAKRLRDLKVFDRNDWKDVRGQVFVSGTTDIRLLYYENAIWLIDLLDRHAEELKSLTEHLSVAQKCAQDNYQLVETIQELGKENNVLELANRQQQAELDKLNTKIETMRNLLEEL